MSKLNLSLKIGKTKIATATGNSGHTTSTVRGEGKEDFPFPSIDVLVEKSVKRAAKKAKTRKPRQKKVETTGADKSGKPEGVSSLLPDLSSLKVNQVVPTGQTRETYTDGQVMLKGADGLQELMIKRQFDALYEARFGEMHAAVNWARANMADKYQKAIDSLDKQLTKLEDSYRQALPQVIDELKKQNPGAPINAVVQKAIEVLDEELSQIIYILKVYTDCFQQLRDGKHTSLLNAVTFFFEQSHKLYWGGDLHVDGGTSPVDAGTERIGDVFLGRVTEMGLATIPGSRGPVGAHAVQIPYEMLDFIPINLPLFGHEARHNVFHDVVGLEQELTAAVGKAVLAAHKAGTLKFNTDTIKLGKQEVPTEQLMAKLYTDWLSEIDADLVGGVLFDGPAFGENMVMSFPAMMIRDGRVSEKVNLLRTGSGYELKKLRNGSVALVFEEHPVDYVRVHIVAAALDEIGFPDSARKLRELADFAVGDELPTKITFRQMGAKPGAGMVIELPVDDVIAVAPVVAKAIIRTPLKAHGGKSCGDLVMWTKKRQDKVEALTEILVKDSSELPTDKGDIHAPYIGAAATLAYLKLVREMKMEPADAALMVSKNALAMLEKLSKQAVKTA
ncbi:MAG: hypothetical protein J0M35_16990 [Candidatus Obscuribacter phosphatis]|uniref:Uncharacterized protein n=1 Tax=Candidatus Obscuribacter phosphatis TaxID=1906157 RepID=A0A8J7PER4_9BACT|nr:hypothetical protein [Candidatus Obscuribacter phosphatis]